LGVAPSHHLLHFWVLVGFAALALRECSTNFRGVLVDFLGIAPSIPVFLGLVWFAGGMEHLFPQCFDGFILL